MSGGRSQYKNILLMLSMAGCAGTSPAVQHPGGAGSELEGVWTEYWSVGGGEAETQRYAFLQGGGFQWTSDSAAALPTAGTPLRKTGSFELQQLDGRRVLLLHVTETELAGCDSACEGDDETAFHISHTPALLEELELGDCPPNAEAKNIDAKYACIALGDHAFWRRGGSAPQQSTAKDVTPTAVVAAPVVAEPPVEPPAAMSGAAPSSTVQ